MKELAPEECGGYAPPVLIDRRAAVAPQRASVLTVLDRDVENRRFTYQAGVTENVEYLMPVLLERKESSEGALAAIVALFAAVRPFAKEDPNPRLGGGYLVQLLVQADDIRRLRAALTACGERLP